MKAPKTKEAPKLKDITPNDIDTSGGFFASGFHSIEAETISRNLMVMMQDAGEWKPFTWEEYKDFCSHNVTDSEREVLDLFVKGGTYRDNIGGHTTITGGCLKKTGQKYEITDKMITMLIKFVKV